MALVSVLQLSNSEGLMKIVVFSGLSHPVVVHPLVHGEPVLTAQAFYYLETLESVAKVRFKTGARELSDEELEYLIDNYLFEYSKKYPNKAMTFKISKGKFWSDDFSDFYLGVDQSLTESLAIDILNDPSVVSIEAIDKGDRVDLQDWDIGRNYAEDCFQLYMESMTSILDKKIAVVIWPNERRDGYMGKLRVLKPGYGLINRSQAMALANISICSIPEAATHVSLEGTNSHHILQSLPLERIYTTSQYNPILLSHYFSGLKEYNPLKGFVGFYNVLEYYFEEAPRLLGRSAANERLQLQCVVDLIVSEAEILDFMESLEPKAHKIIIADLKTSSGMKIKGFAPMAGAQTDLARWLYEIRCAVIHSKKTRKGLATPTFEPYTSASQVLNDVVPVVRWLAVLCIEKDAALTAAKP